MNRTICPSAAWISLRTALSRSSNSPRYLDPASSEPMSRATTRRSRRDSGMSPETILCARPSTIAVLPTPGSPIRTGLFLVRRESTWITRRISSSRPITGSSLPLSASAVRSRPYFSSAPKVSSGFGEVTRWGPRTSEIAWTRSLRAGRRSETPDFDSARARRMCSVEMYSSPRPADSFSACWRTQTNSLEGRTSGTVLPLSRGSFSTASWARRLASCASTPSRCSTGTTTPSSCSSRAASRWAGATSGLVLSEASRCAAATASCDLIVNRSACIRHGW
jgi:hypothetical protein